MLTLIFFVTVSTLLETYANQIIIRDIDKRPMTMAIYNVNIYNININGNKCSVEQCQLSKLWYTHMVE